MSNGETDKLTDRQALERFVVNNDELLQLEDRIGRFNIFDALGIVNAEIRHSNFLAWILDPNESHGQGPLFLNAILMDLFRQSPPELRPINPVEIDGAELRGVEVRREWRDIDILIVCKDPKFVIAIENKIKAGKNNPFEDYERRVKEHFPGTPAMFVILTVDGSEIEDYDWAPYRYEDIHNVLTRVRKMHVASIGDDVLAFLDHYIRLIGSRFMNDPKIDELCQTIVKNHSRAIELLIERTRVGRSELLAAIENHVRSDEKRWVVFGATTRYLSFVPSAWYEAIPKIGAKPRQDPRSWLFWHLWCYDGACRWQLCCSQVKDDALRKKLVETIAGTKAKFGLMPRKRDLSSGWNSLGLKNIEKWSDDEPEPDKLIPKIDKLLTRLEHDLAGVPDALRSVVKAWEKKKRG